MVSLLQWYEDSGVDETISDETLNWFALATTPKSAPVIQATPVASVEQIAREAETRAGNCDNLSALHDAIRNFEGCRLKNTATHTVFSSGNPESAIMLIGDAPGAEEDRQGTPFIGENGLLLDKMFAAIGKSRENDFYITNILPWRPPGNRAPTSDEITICLPFIKRHIELFNPKLIVLLGGIATNSLLNTEQGITRLRGKWKEYDLGGVKIPTGPLFHPGYLVKQPKAKRDTWADLLALKARIEELSL